MKARKQLEELEANTTLRSLSDIESDDTDIEPDDSSCEPDELSYSDSSCDRHSHSVEVLPQINKNVKRKKMSQTETNEKQQQQQQPLISSLPNAFVGPKSVL